MIKLSFPFTEEKIRALKVGDGVVISCVAVAGRDITSRSCFHGVMLPRLIRFAARLKHFVPIWLVLVAWLCPSCAVMPAKEKPVDARVEELLAKMTLTEKVGQMVQISSFKGEIPDDLKLRLRQGRIGSMLNEIVPSANLEIQRIATQESRLGIPVLMGRDVIHGYRTIFPIPLAQACAWDPQLVKDCAAVAADEASTAGFQWTFAPMMDIARDPRWGRIAEGFG